jgi:hypothetical protein
MSARRLLRAERIDLGIVCCPVVVENEKLVGMQAGSWEGL